MTVSFLSKCSQCVKPLIQGSRAFQLLPCEHVVHKLCMDTFSKDFEQCPVCKSEIVRFEMWKEKQVNLGNAGSPGVIPSENKVLTFAQKVEIEKLYFDHLELLKSKSGVLPPTHGFVMKHGILDDPQENHRGVNSGFAKTGDWVEYLLKPTMAKLNIKVASLEYDDMEYATQAYASEYAIVVVNGALDGLIQQPKAPDFGDARSTFFAWRMIKARMQEDVKSRSTFVMNVPTKISDRLAEGLAPYAKHPVEDWETLYVQLLTIAGSILGTPKDDLDGALKLFDQAWSGALEGKTTEPPTPAPVSSVDEKLTRLAQTMREATLKRDAEKNSTMDRLITSIMSAVEKAQQSKPIPKSIWVRYDEKTDKAILDEIIMKLKDAKLNIKLSYDIEIKMVKQDYYDDYYGLETQTVKKEIKHPAFLVNL